MLNLEEIKAREQTATPGPWEAKQEGEYVGFNTPNYGFAVDSAEFSDIDFACHARTDIPALIEQHEQDQQQITTLKKVLTDMLFAYQNKDADCPHQFETEAVHQAQQLTHETHGETEK